MKKYLPLLLVFAFVPAFALVGCDVGDVCACTPALPTGIVHGQVATSAGDPVTEVLVGVHARFAGLDTTVSQGGAYTDESGFYLQHIRGFAGRQIDSVRIVVDLPPIGPEARDGDTTVAVDLRLRTSPPYDSVRVDVVLDR